LDLWNNLIKNKTAKILLIILLMRRFSLILKPLSIDFIAVYFM